MDFLGKLKFFLIAVIFFLSTCASSVSEKREQQILDNYSQSRSDRYAGLLVDESRYTTSGGMYHKKFYKYLIALASDLIEKKSMTIVKGTVGFYYDRKSGSPNALYLGLDIDTSLNMDNGFEASALKILKKNLKAVVHTMNSCKSIFYESEIHGAVIGWKWRDSGRDEQLNIWLKKGDMIQFEDKKLTFEELIQKSDIINTAGKPVRLPI